MTNAYFYSSTAVQTTLTGGISNSSTTAQVASTVGWPASYPFIVAIDYGGAAEELVKVTNNSAGVLTIARAFDSTSAQNHGIGAVVRHVYCANDATNFRTHEAATSGVHGITGNVVGDSDTQTLSNKTLASPIFTGSVSMTNPTIAGAVMSGTWSGSPTFSGNPTFSGVPVLGSATVNGTWTGNAAFVASGAAVIPLQAQGFASQTADIFRVQTSGAANIFRVLPNGVSISNQATNVVPLMINGISGTTTDLMDLQLNGVTVLGIQTSGIIQAQQGVSTNEILGSIASGDTFDRFRIRSDGRFDWGSGAATRDTDLYRSGVGALTTDGKFNASNLTATTTYTPTISGGALTLGNGVMTATYTVAGGMATIDIFIVMGTTSSLASTGGVTFSLPSGVTISASNAANGNGYFTKTSGGAFNVAVTTVSSSVINYFLLRQTDLTFQSWNTTNGAAVVNGSILSASVTFNIS